MTERYLDQDIAATSAISPKTTPKTTPETKLDELMQKLLNEGWQLIAKSDSDNERLPNCPYASEFGDRIGQPGLQRSCGYNGISNDKLPQSLSEVVKDSGTPKLLDDVGNREVTIIASVLAQGSEANAKQVVSAGCAICRLRQLTLLNSDHADNLAEAWKHYLQQIGPKAAADDGSDPLIEALGHKPESPALVGW